MKAIFIFRDGELIGNPIGYTTVKGAKKSLVGCEDWYKQLRKYNPTIIGYNNLPEDLTGIYRWSEVCNSWFFEREKWSIKVWNTYVNEHYQFVEKEFDIIFKD